MTVSVPAQTATAREPELEQAQALFVGGWNHSLARRAGRTVGTDRKTVPRRAQATGTSRADRGNLRFPREIQRFCHSVLVGTGSGLRKAGSCQRKVSSGLRKSGSGQQKVSSGLREAGSWQREAGSCLNGTRYWLPEPDFCLRETRNALAKVDLWQSGTGSGLKKVGFLLEKLPDAR